MAFASNKLRKQLHYEYGKLLGMQDGFVPADEPSPQERATALAISKQADICSDLLDQYEASVPKRAAAYARQQCAPMRKHLAATAILFGVAGGDSE